MENSNIDVEDVREKALHYKEMNYHVLVSLLIHLLMGIWKSAIEV
jgi:hypothetical protein